MKKWSNLVQQREFLPLLFAFFLFLFFLPVMRGDNEAAPQTMYYYMFAVWAVCILVLFLVSRGLRASRFDEGGKK